MIFLLYIQVGTSPSVMVFDDMEMNYDKRTEWVSPSFSNEVFERSGVEKVKKIPQKEKQEIDSDFQVFFLVLLLVMIGEFFASPAIALADSAVIQSLGEKQVLAFLFSSKCQLLWMLTADF